VKCAACHESLRGKKAILFDGKPVCLDPCGRLAMRKTRFRWGAMELSGPELLRLFIIEANRWRSQ
jgi:hypothetical protein